MDCLGVPRFSKAAPSCLVRPAHPPSLPGSLPTGPSPWDGAVVTGFLDLNVLNEAFLYIFMMNFQIFQWTSYCHEMILNDTNYVIFQWIEYVSTCCSASTPCRVSFSNCLVLLMTSLSSSVKPLRAAGALGALGALGGSATVPGATPKDRWRTSAQRDGVSWQIWKQIIFLAI